jgi:hypothetical protein
MRTINGVQVFTIADVVVGDLSVRSPDEVERDVRQWCFANDAVYGVGDESSLVEKVSSAGGKRVVLAEG